MAQMCTRRPATWTLSIALVFSFSSTSLADELTPKFDRIETSAKDGKWLAVLDGLTELAPNSKLDFRFFYWRTLAFYYSGWLEAGDQEARLAEQYIDVAPLTDESKKQLKEALKEARAPVATTQVTTVKRDDSYHGAIEPNHGEKPPVVRHGASGWTGRFPEEARLMGGRTVKFPEEVQVNKGESSSVKLDKASRSPGK